MKKIAVLASGKGSNLEAILEAEAGGKIAGKVVLVLSDVADAFALERARRRGVRALFVDPASSAQRAAYDRMLVGHLEDADVDLVVLAGFMRLLSPFFVQAFPGRIMNIHPSLLPAFPGLHGVDEALAYGVRVSGCTVHFVDEGLDTGPIILQEAVPVLDSDTAATLQQRIHGAEHRLYPTALDLFCRDKLKVEGRRCMIIE